MQRGGLEVSGGFSQEPPVNLVRAVGWSDGRRRTVCVCVGSLTGRGRSLLGADYNNELDNGAGVCVY